MSIAEEMSFLEHLEDLRSTLIKSISILVLGMLIAAPLAPHTFQLLKQPLVKAGQDPDTFLMQLNVVGGLSISMHIIFWSGLLLSLPVIIYFIGTFIFPGLHERERKIIMIAGLISVLLFAAGATMAYFFSSYALTFMFAVSKWIGLSQEKVLATDYISFMLKLLIGCGLAFEFPEILYVLGRLGIVHTTQLRSKRRHVFIGILLLSMMLTPQDPLSMVAMAIPLYLLYEICILLIARHE